MNTTAPQRIIISGVGPDHPGIVAELTDLLSRHHCNIEDTSMTILGGHFAMLLLVSVPASVSPTSLKPELEAVEQKAGIHLSIYSANALPNKQPDIKATHTPYMITVSGNDRTGITAESSHLLAQHHINITDLNAHVIPGEDGPVYILMMESLIPNTQSIDAFTTDLKALGKKLGVEVQCREIDAETL